MSINIKTKVLAALLAVSVLGGVLILPNRADACFECGAAAGGGGLFGGGLLPMLATGFLFSQLGNDEPTKITNNNYNTNNNHNNSSAIVNNAQPVAAVAVNQSPTINVHGDDHPVVYDGYPSHQKIYKRVKVGQTLSFSLSGSDPDGDTLTYHALSLPIGSHFNYGSRTFTWTPTRVGTYSATFRAYDRPYSYVDIYVVIEVVNSAPIVNVHSHTNTYVPTYIPTYTPPAPPVYHPPVIVKKVEQPVLTKKKTITKKIVKKEIEYYGYGSKKDGYKNGDWDENEEEFESGSSNSGNGFLGIGGIGSIGGLMPWLLILIIIVLLFMLYSNHKREKERQQLADIRASYERKHQSQ